MAASIDPAGGAAGAEHELNNALMAVQGYARKARDAVGTASPAHDELGRVLEAADRAIALAQRLAALTQGLPADRDLSAAGTAEEPGPRPVALVAEDNPMVLDLAVDMLERQGFDVVGTAGGAEALAVLRDRSDVKLLVSDIVMPGMDGVELASSAAGERPELAIVLMSGYAARHLGSGLGPSHVVFLAKPFTLEQLATAVQRAVEEASAPRRDDGKRSEPLPRLTPREVSVLGLLAKGRTNDQAGRDLGISPETVQTHVHNAMRKLGADSRTHAVAVALRLGMIA